MKKLIDFLADARVSGDSDLTVIRHFLEQEGMLSDAIKLLTSICNKQSNDLMRFKSKTQTHMCYPVEYYYKNYDIETAYYLDYLTRKLQLDLPMNDRDIKWMKEFDIRNAKSPFWHDLLEVIKVAQDENYEPHFYDYNPTNQI